MLTLFLSVVCSWRFHRCFRALASSSLKVIVAIVGRPYCLCFIACGCYLVCGCCYLLFVGLFWAFGPIILNSWCVWTQKIAFCTSNLLSAFHENFKTSWMSINVLEYLLYLLHLFPLPLWLETFLTPFLLSFYFLLVEAFLRRSEYFFPICIYFFG